MRRHLASLTAGVLLLTLLPVVAPPADAAKRKKKPSVRVRVKRVTPGSLQPTGTRVNISTKITVKGANVQNVWALGKVVGGATGEWFQLRKRKANVYAGSFDVPGNPRATRGTAEVYLNVRTSRGNVQRIVKRLPIVPGDDSLPPPPPAR